MITSNYLDSRSSPRFSSSSSLPLYSYSVSSTRKQEFVILQTKYPSVDHYQRKTPCFLGPTLLDLHIICLPFSPLFLRVRSMWSLSWIRTWRSVGWSLMKECLSSCSVDGRVVYVFTRQPSIKSMNFLDLGGRGRSEDDKLVRERGRVGRHGTAGLFHYPESQTESINTQKYSSDIRSVCKLFHMSKMSTLNKTITTFGKSLQNRLKLLWSTKTKMWTQQHNGQNKT